MRMSKKRRIRFVACIALALAFTGAVGGVAHAAGPDNKAAKKKEKKKDKKKKDAAPAQTGTTGAPVAAAPLSTISEIDREAQALFKMVADYQKSDYNQLTTAALQKRLALNAYIAAIREEFEKRLRALSAALRKLSEDVPDHRMLFGVYNSLVLEAAGAYLVDTTFFKRRRIPLIEATTARETFIAGPNALRNLRDMILTSARAHDAQAGYAEAWVSRIATPEAAVFWLQSLDRVAGFVGSVAMAEAVDQVQTEGGRAFLLEWISQGRAFDVATVAKIAGIQTMFPFNVLEELRLKSLAPGMPFAGTIVQKLEEIAAIESFGQFVAAAEGLLRSAPDALSSAAGREDLKGLQLCDYAAARY